MPRARWPLNVSLVVMLVGLLGACAMSEGSGSPIAPASGAVRSANAAGHGRQRICTAGTSCLERCLQGNCGITCQAGSNCNQTCIGGNCAQTCEMGAVCNFSCGGGYCLQRCSDRSCRTSCNGGGCILEIGDEPVESPAEQAPPGEAPPSGN